MVNPELDHKDQEDFRVDIMSLLRPVIQELAEGYDSAPNLDEIAVELGIPVEQIAKLDAGENPFLKSPEIDWKTIGESLAYYPDASASKLRRALSDDLGVAPEMITVGN